jgi:hypothetical protein
MESADNSGKTGVSTKPPVHTQDAAASAAADVPGSRPFGPHAAAILATEHWSLLASGR